MQQPTSSLHQQSIKRSQPTQNERLPFRLGKELSAKIRSIAKAERRSVSKQITLFLEEVLNTKEDNPSMNSGTPTKTDQEIVNKVTH